MKIRIILPVIGLLIAAIIFVGAGCGMTNDEDATEVDETSTTVTTVSDDSEKEIMETYQDVTPAEAKDLIESESNLVILDVSNSYAKGHIPGAINYYVGDGSLDDAIPTLDKDKPYLVYCHVDSASISGANKLIDAGFPEVYRLEGNYSAWVDAGYEIEE